MAAGAGEDEGVGPGLGILAWTCWGWRGLSVNMGPAVVGGTGLTVIMGPTVVMGATVVR